MKQILNKIKFLLDNINKNHIEQYTAQCSYFTILSFIPILILILTLTKYIGIDKETLYVILNKILPNNIVNDTILGIIREVYSKSIGTITISIIFILWSAGKGFYALCKGLYSIYNVNEVKKNIYFRIKAVVCTIAFILLIIGTLLFLVFGNSINEIVKERFKIINNFLNIILQSKHIIIVIILSIIFIVAYKFIPKNKGSIKNQIFGAILSAIACDIISIFYSVYINYSTGFSVMYGSLTTIVLAMLWLYSCMYSFLLGALINKLLLENVEKGQ